MELSALRSQKREARSQIEERFQKKLISKGQLLMTQVVKSTNFGK